MRIRSGIAASALLLAALGCRDETTSPTMAAPIAPQLATAGATALSFRLVAGGSENTCGVTTNYAAYCWGDNDEGALGIGLFDSDTFQLAPVAVLGGIHFKQLSGSWGNTCGVTTDSLAYCWGGNTAGQLGIGNRTGPERCDAEDIVGGSPCSTRPVAVKGGLRFAQVDVASEHACGVTLPDRRAYCWGMNGGRLGDGTTTTRLTPVAVAGSLRFRQVSTTYGHTCGVTTDNKAYCWGDNSQGQLGDSTEVARRLRPTRVSGTRQFIQVEAGVFHTCGVTTGYRAFCWGSGGWGQLGNGKTYLSFWPRLVAGGLSLRRLTAGHYHTCGETTGNRAYCWGLNSEGQLGDGTTTQRLKPVAVVGGLYFSQVGAGWNHTCAKTLAGVLYCWGANHRGQVGDGTRAHRWTPTRVAGAL